MTQLIATLTPKIIEILTPLFLATLTWASYQLAGYIKAHTKNLQTQAMLLRLNDAVATAVESVEQTKVSPCKVQSSGKALSVDEAATFKSIALEQVKTNLGDKGLSETMRLLDIDHPASLERILGNKIEAHVLKLPVPIPTMLDLGKM
jgi:hypothetical protein